MLEFDFCVQLRGKIGFIKRFEMSMAEIPTPYIKLLKLKTDLKYMSKEAVRCCGLLPSDPYRKLYEAFESAIE